MNKQNIEILKCIFDSANSFYNKSGTILNDSKLILISYDTEVAYIKDNIAFVNGTYSQTTLRHIKEFLKQNGFKADTKTQILKDYSITPGRVA